MKKAIVICIALVTLSAADDGPLTQNMEAFRVITTELDRPIHPQFGALNFDLLDLPQRPEVPCRLEDARQAGEKVDIDKDLAGNILVMVEINPKSQSGAWKSNSGDPVGVAGIKTAAPELEGMGAQLVLVWHYQRNVPPDQARAEASAYIAEYQLPGLLLLDGPPVEQPEKKRQPSAYYAYANSFLPGHPPHDIVCIRDAEGRFVFRSRETAIGFCPHTAAHIVRRLVDPAYDAAVREEFQSAKSLLLPIVEVKPNGLLYRDDFESYTDSRTFKLEPRWGFSYARQSRLDLRPDIDRTAGRGGSACAHYRYYKDAYGLAPYGMQYRFPAPLTEGYVSFYIRRGPGNAMHTPDDEWKRGARLRRSFVVCFDRPGSYMPAGYIMGSGLWMKETFCNHFRMNDPGSVPYAADAWQKVMVKCTPGRKAEITVDGTRMGALDSASVGGIRLRPENLGKTFYIDDVEIFYAGDAGTLRNEHRQAAGARREPFAGFSSHFIEALKREYEPLEKGPAAVFLPAGHLPRADTGYWSPPFMTFDHRIPAPPLILDDLRRPGEKVDVLKKYRGKILWVTRVHKGDHSREITTRKRTLLQSPTVFNRVYRLTQEYKPKGIVVVAVGAVDGGHRDTCTAYEDRMQTTFENACMAPDLCAEFDLPENRIIYGCFPEAYDEVVGERFPNQLRLWNGTMRGDLQCGAFAGMGAGVVIDPEGRIVYRGSGPDGNSYWKVRYALDRLLDPEFDKACRQEFRNPDLPHYQSPQLPIVRKTPEGLFLRDDFENYEDTYAFGLQPRWGMTYANYPNEHTAAVFADSGRNGSRAILLNNFQEADKFCGNMAGEVGARHSLLSPLADGCIRFYIKRGPKVKWPYFGRPPLYRFGVCFYDGDGNALETLTTLGDWEQEEMVLAETDAFVQWSVARPKNIEGRVLKHLGFNMSKDAWHEIVADCRPGRNVELKIDGRPAGELSAAALGAVEFREETWSGTWLDDFEVFYRGDADALAAQLGAWESARLEELQRLWAKE